ncbi:MAG: hypothetical protein Q6362_003585 [Candidatus Wukongarchaeota archaeon]|nr:hypothetical protein [Candidatus Wukongarchaeota archaeon]
MHSPERVQRHPQCGDKRETHAGRRDSANEQLTRLVFLSKLGTLERHPFERLG